MSYGGPERRKHPRIDGKFVVSYRVEKESDHPNTSQTRNLGIGGMVLTTNRSFSSGTILTIDIHLPFITEKMNIKGKVLESKEIVKDLIYDTRITFLNANPNSIKTMNDTVSYYQNYQKNFK